MAYPDTEKQYTPKNHCVDRITLDNALSSQERKLFSIKKSDEIYKVEKFNSLWYALYFPQLTGLNEIEKELASTTDINFATSQKLYERLNKYIITYYDTNKDEVLDDEIEKHLDKYKEKFIKKILVKTIGYIKHTHWSIAIFNKK